MRRAWHNLVDLDDWPVLQGIPPWRRVFAYIWIYGWLPVASVTLILVVLDVVTGWGLLDRLTG